MNISIRLEKEKDYRTVEYLTREAFWDLYHPGCTEHLIVHKIRKVPLLPLLKTILSAVLYIQEQKSLMLRIMCLKFCVWDR